jgi:iron complex transport system ATP-binding protein
MRDPLTLRAATVRRDGREVLSAASLTVARGEVVGVIGPNGAGKTTLLRAALGLVGSTTSPPELAFPGRGDAARARSAGYLPQDRRVAWNLPAWRVASLGAPNLKPPAARVRALAALERVGLAGLEDRGVLDMSGGERGRVLIARLLVTQAPLLVADEPAAGLDPDAQLLAMALLREEAEKGAGVLVTLHDLGLAARACDRLVVLSRGRIVADAAPRAALTSEVLREVFGLQGALLDTPAGLVLAARRA